ncbi:hypothetical protein KUV28_17675 [Ferrimonas balearica]|nr:hypothetical protein [Ferrimonas balearica]
MAGPDLRGAARPALPADVHQGVAGVDAALREGVLDALSTVFGARDLPAPWAASDLTADRFPLEFGFHGLKDTLYWTADPAAGLAPRARLARVLSLVTRLGQGGGHPLIDILPDLPIMPRAGAWLSGRHDLGEALRCKVYTDWSDHPEARALTPDILLPRRLPNGARPVLRGIGLGPGSERAELYYRFHHASLRHVRHILSAAGLQGRADQVCAAITDMAAGDPDRLLDRAGMIASLAQDRPGAAVEVTFYFFPQSFLGSDRSCRAAFLGVLRACGRNPRPYAAASMPVRQRVARSPCHGFVALTVTARGQGWGIGLRSVTAPTLADKDRIKGGCNGPYQD